MENYRYKTKLFAHIQAHTVFNADINGEISRIESKLIVRKKDLLPKSLMVKFLIFLSSCGDLKEKLCSVIGISSSFALKI